MSGGTEQVSRLDWRDGQSASTTDSIAIEAPVALVYNGVSHVVTMASPQDLEDLALGFSLSEGIIDSPEQLLDCDIDPGGRGIEVQMRITGEPFARLQERRRNLTGRTGCGLCGLESLEQALPEPVRVASDCQVHHQALQHALAQLDAVQPMKQHTGGVHGAAWCDLDGNIQLAREDVGRHNALDKLLGALARGRFAAEGFVLVSSRASYEMVAKVAASNIPLLATVSAPTSLAVDYARDCDLTLVSYVQPGRQAVYTHPERVLEEATA